MNSSEEGYGGQGGTTQGQIHNPDANLPFTGYDIGLIGIGALVMVIVGAAISKKVA